MERRGIGHRVPILGGRRLAEVVPLVGGACPSGYCHIIIQTGFDVFVDVLICSRMSSK